MTPNNPLTSPSPAPARWWERTPEGRIACHLCPRGCVLEPGKRGYCHVRRATSEGMVLTAWGQPRGLCIDPIEKKPLYHFHPGTPVLSFGTIGCNLGCRFCQNWSLSRSRESEDDANLTPPDRIADLAERHGCTSVAFTYNDPVIFAEYAMETAHACRERGIHTVAVTAGYISPPAREAFFEPMDAANVDLKSFRDDFYRKWCQGRLQPVIDTIDHLVNHTDTWVELTTMLIPGLNDDDDEIRDLTGWVVDRLGPHVPLHFSAFHPAWKVQDRQRTPLETLIRARSIAIDNGMHHVFTGNVPDPTGNSTWCPHCNKAVIERLGARIGTWRLEGGRCAHCGTPVAGRFPGTKGDWGPRRRPVDPDS